MSNLYKLKFNSRRTKGIFPRKIIWIDSRHFQAIFLLEEFELEKIMHYIFLYVNVLECKLRDIE